MRLRCAFSFENAISIGFRSGLYGGRNRNQQSRFLRAFAAAAFLWVARLVEDHDSAWLQSGCKLGADVGFKGQPVHRALDNPRCNQAVNSQPGDKGLCVPRSKRGRGMKALPFQGPPAQASEIGLHRGFINEHKSLRGSAHGRQTVFYPVSSGVPDVGLVALICNEALFLNVYPARLSARSTEE